LQVSTRASGDASARTDVAIGETGRSLRPHAVRTVSRVTVCPDEPPPREITPRHVVQELPRTDPALGSPARDRQTDAQDVQLTHDWG